MLAHKKKILISSEPQKNESIDETTLLYLLRLVNTFFWSTLNMEGETCLMVFKIKKGLEMANKMKKWSIE